MENPPLIGKNIQKIRASHSLTLNVLSERSGVSKAMLSQIETDKVNPTVATVWKIARGLGVDLQELLNIDAAPKRKFIVNRSETSESLETDAHGVTIKVLSPLDMAEDVELYLLEFEPKTTLQSDPHYPGTEEYLTVIKGAVTVTAGDNTCDLHKGDFLAYHCDIGHTITNDAASLAVVHMVVHYTQLKK
ncbi:MAG: helix-turn-helix domain-containing protein [Sphaerochaetaceae bacterium]|jgi:transcriptional regulator with XRE-family HTH domain